MSMLIRSQNKKSIKCFGSRDTIYILDSTIFIDGSVYGEYSTEEKAIKVLDMIQVEYKKHIFGEGGQMFTRDLYVPAFAFIPPKVFQMPQDSEV